MIDSLKIDIASFPKQGAIDNESCGVFMLCGITDLIKLNAITFK